VHRKNPPTTQEFSPQAHCIIRQRSKSATASETKPKKTKLHEDEAGTFAEKRKKKYKALKKQDFFPEIGHEEPQVQKQVLLSRRNR
jgi:hypothetical protein